jgi:hypothetical protein
VKKISLFVLLFGVFASSLANATIVQCITGGNPTGTFAYATWSTWTSGSAGVTGCEIGDKIFQNFAPGAIPTDTTVQFTQSSLPGGAFAFTISFLNTGLGGLNVPFAVGYNVAVDPTLNPDGTPVSPGAHWAINRIASGLLDSNGNATASVVKNCGAGCQASSSATGGVVTTLVATPAPATSFNITDTYSYTSGVVTGISNTYQQINTATPEPSTFVLLGGAMVGLGLLRRRTKTS